MEDYPKRKQIRLPCYDYSNPGGYFVTICTENRRCILSEIVVGADALGGPSVSLTKTGKIVEKYLLSTENMPDLRVDKYVIMPNHVHAILVVGNGPPRASAPTRRTVSNAIGAWKRLVHRECGETVFQRSFHDHIIRGEKDYHEIWAYIDNNPAKWLEDRYYTE